MSRLDHVERRIRRIEGFAVCFLYLDGRNVRGDKSALPGYPFTHAASKSITVEAWKRTRFRQVYPGYDVAVLDGAGMPVQGNTRLSTVRRSYA